MADVCESGFGGGGVYQGSTAGGGTACADRFTNRDAPPGGVAHDVCVGAHGEAGVGVAEVLVDFVERASLVEQQRGAGVPQVVAAEVRKPCALERGNPDAASPVVPAEVAPGCREDKLAKVWSAAGEVELDELAGDRLE